MPIKLSDIGPDDVTARRILIRAREVAPCISTFAEGSEEYLDAVAILSGVYGRAAAIGSGAVASQSRNGTAITFREVKSAFDADDLSGLRSLCSVAGTDSRRALPAGSFPLDRPLGRVFPRRAVLLMWDGPFWYPHQVTVAIATGSAGMGSHHAAPVGIAAEVKDEQRIVRAADGSEVVSSTTVTVPLDSGVTAGSLVTVWAGTVHERTSTVVAVQRDENDAPLPAFLILSLK